MTHALRTQPVLWIASVGFEVACIYAWAAFTLGLVQERPYSPWLAAATFGCGSLTAGWLRRSELPGLERVLIHSLGLLLLGLLALYCDALLVRSHTLREWLAVSVTLGWSCVLWLVGARHGREDLSYDKLCSRFDRAIGWLAELFVVKLCLRLLPKPGVSLTDHVAGGHVAAFLCFALVALVSARSRGETRPDANVQSRGRIGLAAHTGVGPLLGVGAAISLCALGVAWLYLPQLRAAAQAGAAVLAPLAGLLGSLLALFVSAVFAVMRFMIGPHFNPPPRKKLVDMSQLPPDQPQDTVGPQAAHHSDLWYTLTAGALSALLLCAFGWILWRYLRRRRASLPTHAQRRRWQRLGWFARDDRPEALRLYAKLEAWGRRSGMAARPQETPLEYSRRLQRHLPSTRAEIDTIVRAINLHLYAPVSQPLLTLHLERTALRRLRSPRLWPQRFKLRVLGA